MEIQLINNLTQITMTTERLVILYRGEEQSSIRAKEKIFLIGEYGNHLPPQDVFFSGKMGNQRVANMFPLNYAFDKKQ